MERYSEYKDSGIKWLGEIPSHWEVVPLRKYLKINTRRNMANAKLLSVTREEGVIVRNVESKEENHNYIPDDLSNYKFVQKGQFVINKMKSWQGSYGVSAYDGIVSPAYFVYDLKYPNKEYFNRAIRSKVFSPFFSKYSKGIRVDQWDLMPEALKIIPFLEPPVEEQDTIVRYLDAATSKIDKAIAMQQKMIDLLNERKQIIIQNAVTKGLDENVEMKDSNCKFLGKIPSTWEVCKTLYVLSMPITDGPHTTPQLYDDGIPFVSAEAVSCGNGYIDFSHIRGYISDSFYNECCKKYIPQRDDIYMIKSGATTGKVAIVNTDVKFTIWSPLAVFRVNKKKVLPYFLYYSLQSSYYQLQVQDKWSFGTQQNIGMRMLEKLILCYPSIEEQAKIVAFIKKNVDNFDSAISNSQRQIALLQERKQIIINEVVTGKVKVS